MTLKTSSGEPFVYTYQGTGTATTTSYNRSLDFCIWTLTIDGLQVAPFDRHGEGTGELRAVGLTAANWREWFDLIVLLSDDRLNQQVVDLEDELEFYKKHLLSHLDLDWEKSKIALTEEFKHKNQQYEIALNALPKGVSPSFKAIDFWQDQPDLYQAMRQLERSFCPTSGEAETVSEQPLQAPEDEPDFSCAPLKIERCFTPTAAEADLQQLREVFQNQYKISCHLINYTVPIFYPAPPCSVVKSIGCTDPCLL